MMHVFEIAGSSHGNGPVSISGVYASSAEFTVT